MNDEKSKREKQNAQDEQRAQNTGQQYQKVFPYEPAEEDEIDLSELLAVVFRRKAMILVLTLAITVLAFGAAMVQPKKYGAATMIEIGQFYQDEDFILIEAMNSVQNRLRSFGKVIFFEMQEHYLESSSEKNGKKTGLGFSIENDFKIETPKQGRILTMQLKTQNRKSGKQFLSNLVEKLIKNHETKQVLEKNKVKNQIRIEQEQKLEINHKIQENFDNIRQVERNLKEKMIAGQNKLDVLEDKIVNIRSGKKLQRERITYLKDEKKQLARQISEVEKRYDSLVQSRRKAGSQVDEGGSVALMLFNSEVQHTQEYLSQMRERLFFKIPEQISELMSLIKELDTDIAAVQNSIKLEKQRLAQLQPNFEDEKKKYKRVIASLQSNSDNTDVRIKELKQQIASMSKTSMVFPPRTPKDPSRNVKRFVMLGFAAGLFLSIFAAFLFEFWANNREKILK